MTTIYKYPLRIQSFQRITLPRNAEILSAQIQGGNICLWAKVDTSEPLESQSIAIYGTGQELPDSEMTHIATVQMDEFVWHVFEISKQ